MISLVALICSPDLPDPRTRRSSITMTRFSLKNEPSDEVRTLMRRRGHWTTWKNTAYESRPIFVLVLLNLSPSHGFSSSTCWPEWTSGSLTASSSIGGHWTSTDHTIKHRHLSSCHISVTGCLDWSLLSDRAHCCDRVSHGHPLSTLAFALMKKSGLVPGAFQIQEEILAQFLCHVEESYPENR